VPDRATAEDQHDQEHDQAVNRRHGRFLAAVESLTDIETTSRCPGPDRVSDAGPLFSAFAECLSRHRSGQHRKRCHARCLALLGGSLDLVRDDPDETNSLLKLSAAFGL
jgi:hypothetical protein